MNRRKPSCGFGKSHDTGSRNAHASNTAKRGAANFVVVTARKEVWASPRHDCHTRRTHFRLPPFAKYAKDGAPTAFYTVRRDQSQGTRRRRATRLNPGSTLQRRRARINEGRESRKEVPDPGPRLASTWGRSRAPQGLKPASCFCSGGTARSRALPKALVARGGSGSGGGGGRSWSGACTVAD